MLILGLSDDLISAAQQAFQNGTSQQAEQLFANAQFHAEADAESSLPAPLFSEEFAGE